MTWAAMEYLLAALRSSRRKIQLEQLLLLLVRVMLVMSVVTAVAEPLLERGLAFVAGQRTHRLLVIDGSFSMAYRPTDKSRFDQAKELAARIVEESPRGDGFTLVLIGAPPRTVVRTPVFEPRDFLREIENLKLPHATSDLRATLQEVERVLTDARREQPRLQRAVIYFLSDLCRVGWLPEHDSPAALAEIHQRTKRLAKAADLVVVDVGQDDAENAAVTDLRTAEPFATVNREFPVEAVLKNFGRQPRPRQRVDLWADGRQVRQQTVNLPPGEDVAVAFPDYRFESPGDHALEVRLQSDQLDIDNHRYLSVPVKPAVQVLCVDGRPSGDPLRGATGYLATALNPPGGDLGPGRAPRRHRPRKAGCWRRSWPITIASSWPTWPSSPPTRPRCWTPISRAAAGWSSSSVPRWSPSATTASWPARPRAARRYSRPSWAPGRETATPSSTHWATPTRSSAISAARRRRDC